MTVGAAPVKTVHLIFAGVIDQAGAQRICQGLNAAMSDGVGHVHLMLQSAGGNVGDGVFLYNIFRSAPIGLTLYNGGQVCSSATIAFLGARSRIASPACLFMMHPTHFSPQFASGEMLGRLNATAAMEDARINAIFSEHLTLTDEQRATLKSADLWLHADDAVAAGLATSIGDFDIPKGERSYFL